MPGSSQQKKGERELAAALCQKHKAAASVCCSREVNMEAAIEKYNDDLPSPELISTELRPAGGGKHAIVKWLRNFGLVLQLQPSRIATVIYPNIRVLLQVACTLPVTSCECERSASYPL